MKESNAIYRRLFESANAAILIIDADFHFIECNEMACKLFNRPIEEILATSPDELSPKYQKNGELSSELGRKYFSSAMQGNDLRFEWVHLKKDGTEFTVEVSLFGFRASNKKNFFAMWRDLTEVEKKEQELIESEERFRTIFSKATDGVILHSIDIKLGITHCNEAAYKILGCDSSDELIGKSVLDISPELQANGDKSSYVGTVYITECLKKGQTRFEWIFLKKDKSPIWFDIVLTKITFLNEVYIHSVWRDITELRKAEDALRENEVRLRNLSNNLPGGMTYQLDMGKNGEMRQFIYVGAGVEKIHELTAVEVINDSGILYKQIVEEDALLLGELEAQAQENMTPFIAEVRFRLPSGKLQWHLIKSAPRWATNGHLIWDGIDFDITERKQVELELEKYKNNLQELVDKRTLELESALNNLKETQSQLIQSEKIASLGILTAGVAHEINNPLNYIMGGYIGLSNELDDDGNIRSENTATFLKGIKLGVDRAAGIVKGLNQLGRSNENYTEICDIHSILDNCLSILHNKFENRIELVKNYCMENAIIKGNAGKLHQVFLNVISNAIDSIKERKTISISTNSKENVLEILIEDTGCGISKGNLNKIVDPFFTTKAPGQGTGLGLSITNTIIHEHQGEIKFHSEENKGTKVVIQLPRNM